MSAKRGFSIVICAVLLGMRHPVYAQVSQSPTVFTPDSGNQTVTIQFTNSTGDQVTALDAYVDQSYLQMGTGTATLGNCADSSRIDDGNWRFSGCDISPGTVAQGSFPVVSVGGEYVDSDLSMNYVYGGGSNQVSVTVQAATPTSTGTPSPTPTTSQTSTAATPTPVRILVTPTPSPTPIPDRVPPEVRLITDLSKPFLNSPDIEGVASDISGVSTDIEFSYDNGKNWTPVGSVVSEGRTRTRFRFSPGNLLDDTYILKVRTKDLLGNQGISQSSWKLTIDRLPPRVGEYVFTLGSQTLHPDGFGRLITVAGLSHGFSLRAAGGPTSIVITSHYGQISALSKNKDTGLWYGTAKFSSPGTYVLMSEAVDGAGNRQSKTIGTVEVLPLGRISDGTRGSDHAAISVYIYDRSKNTFVLWDGDSFGQENPMRTGEDGSYAMYLPSGTYYLRIKKSGYQTLVSEIFSVPQGTPITSSFRLAPSRRIRILSLSIPLPDFRETHSAVRISPMPPGIRRNSSNGKELLAWQFTVDEGKNETVDFRSHETLISIMGTWTPYASRQLEELSKITASGQRVIVISPFESIESVSLLNKRAKYPFTVYADPDGRLWEYLELQTGPIHVRVNKRGMIDMEALGIYTREQLERMLK